MVTCTNELSYSNNVSPSDVDIANMTGGYTGNSFTILVLIILLPAMSIYNAIELLVLIFFTFNKYKGVYFWSLLIASAGVIPYSLGFLLKFGNITNGSLRWLNVALLTPGWWAIVTGQSFVLWSRLHLLLEGEKGRKTLVWTRNMIIINFFILQLPTTVLTFGANGGLQQGGFVRVYNIMEKIQMSGFFIQEVILSTIYIMATVRILKTSIREHTQKLMLSLLGINIIIIVMDMGLLGLEIASQYLLETLVKGLIYSIKLKFEFAILGQLVKFVGGKGTTSVVNEERIRRASVQYFGRDANDKASHDTLGTSETSGFGAGFVSNFTELTKLGTHASQAPSTRKQSIAVERETGDGNLRTRADSVRLPPGMTLEDVNMAMFQHAEDSAISPIEAGAGDVVAQVVETKHDQQKVQVEGGAV